MRLGTGIHIRTIAKNGSRKSDVSRSNARPLITPAYERLYIQEAVDSQEIEFWIQFILR